VNLLCAFARDPDYFAVGSPRALALAFAASGCLSRALGGEGGGGGESGPLPRGSENWFRTLNARRAFVNGRTFGKDDARRRDATRRDATLAISIARTPGVLKGAERGSKGGLKGT